MTERSAKGRHILVVNDTEEILDLFRDIVEGLGHRMTAWSFYLTTWPRSRRSRRTW